MNTNQQLRCRVDNPCPFVPKESNRNADGFFCKGCTKTIIDFRGMSDEEIIQKIDSNTCGIFNSDQLTHQQSISWSKKPLFYGMLLMSFLGFSVRPIYGQTQTPVPVKAEEPTPPSTGEIPTISKSDLKKINPIPKEYTTRTGRREKRVFKTVGCPSF